VSTCDCGATASAIEASLGVSTCDCVAWLGSRNFGEWAKLLSARSRAALSVDTYSGVLGLSLEVAAIDLVLGMLQLCKTCTFELSGVSQNSIVSVTFQSACP
jgi:hypothetical protein